MKKVNNTTKKHRVSNMLQEKLTVLKWWAMTISTKLLVHPDSCTQEEETDPVQTETRADFFKFMVKGVAI